MTPPTSTRARLLRGAAPAALAIGLASPALRHGWAGDDWYHKIVLGQTGLLGERHPTWDLFRFLAPGPTNDALAARGLLPWWADLDVRAGFLRPISALTHQLDQALWPDSAALQHAHSLLWFGLAVALWGALLRGWLRPAAAGAGLLAALLYAVDDGHAVPAAWLANRNSLVALSFTAGSLIAWGRWLAAPRVFTYLVSLTLGGAALLAAEAGLAVVAWVAAWQLTLAPGPLPRRLTALLPWAALVVGWRLIYDAWGYGASASGLYIDPGAGLLRFAGALAIRLPVLLSALWLPLPVDLWAALHQDHHLPVAIAALLPTAAVLALAAPLLRRDDPSGARARFALLGALLCAVPPSAAFPMDRVLGPAAAGAAALLALLATDPALGAARRRAARALVVVHAVAGPALLFGRTATLDVLGQVFDAGADAVPVAPGVADQTVIFVNGTDFTAVYTVVVREVRGGAPAPAAVGVLGPALSRTALHRPDAQTLVLRPDGGFLGRGLERLMRSAERPFRVGDRARRPGFEAEVREITADGRPAEVAFHFDRPLEDPGYLWMSFEGMSPWGEHLVPWTPPPVGAQLQLGPALPLR